MNIPGQRGSDNADDQGDGGGGAKLYAAQHKKDHHHQRHDQRRGRDGIKRADAKANEDARQHPQHNRRRNQRHDPPEQAGEPQQRDRYADNDIRANRFAICIIGQGGDEQRHTRR